MENKITKDMEIGEVLELHPGMAQALTACGMHCVGCASSQGETLEEAAAVHGIALEVLLMRLNTFLRVLEG